MYQRKVWSKCSYSSRWAYDGAEREEIKKDAHKVAELFDFIKKSTGYPLWRPLRNTFSFPWVRQDDI